MKTTLTLLGLSFLLSARITAQVVTEDVNFDFYQNVSNNDLVNHFSGGNGMTQIQTGGITGGCLSMPDSVNWGNDNAIYCTKYKPNSGDTAVTSVCFKYDSTTVNLSNYDRAMSIWLSPNADFNHYVTATVSGNKKIELLTYAWNNNPYPNLNLFHNHWYQYNLTTAYFSALFQVYIKAEVFDIGLSGTSVPLLVNSDSHTITDTILAADTAIRVSITGAKYGGGAYLDNFHFYGRKGYSNCINTTGIDENVLSDKLSVYPSPVDNILHFVKKDGAGGEMTVTLFNLQGEKLMEENWLSKSVLDLNVSKLSNGIYFARCETKTETSNYKIIVSR